MFCPKCGAQIPDDYRFCSNCGLEITVQAPQSSVPNSSAPNTGNSVNYTQPPIVINNINTNTNNNGGVGGISIKSKWVAFLLCLFVGMLGVHRFYVGKVGTGIIWLVSGGVCGIGWLVDLIVILCGGFTDSAGCFLKR